MTGLTLEGLTGDDVIESFIARKASGIVTEHALRGILSGTAQRDIAVARLKQRAIDRLVPTAPEEDPELWLKTVFPRLDLVDFGERHSQLWNWASAVERRQRTKPFVAIWPRGSGKSTTAELAATYLGALGKRFYVWYISSTQALADLHVESIGALIESETFGEYYPRMSSRSMGKFGNIRGWRRNRMRCDNGFTIDALGLDTGARGSKVEEQRPDLIILDDLDEVSDSDAATAKKIKTITTSILPAGSSDVAILAIQNLILNNGIFGKIASRTADYLLDAELSGPFPAIYDMETEQREGRFYITGGTPSWGGQTIETCQSQIDTWGFTAFLREAQHDIRDEGSLFSHIEFRHVEPHKLPDMMRVVTVVDPAVTATDHSDSHGINISGLGEDDVVYHLWSFEKIVTPKESIETAIRESMRLGADTLFVETNQGGNLWRYLYDQIVEEMEIDPRDAPTFMEIKVSGSDGNKIERASGMLADYERGQIAHAKGTHQVLEEALQRFPVRKPYDLTDAAVHCHRELRSGASWAIF